MSNGFHDLHFPRFRGFCLFQQTASFDDAEVHTMFPVVEDGRDRLGALGRVGQVAQRFLRPVFISFVSFMVDPPRFLNTVFRIFLGKKRRDVSSAFNAK